jgi:hypothetical protein
LLIQIIKEFVKYLLQVINILVKFIFLNPHYFNSNYYLFLSLGFITTIAGTGSIGNSGDNGLAILALLFNPIGIKLDNIGNIYIIDNGNEVIRKINNAGIISTAVGSGFKGFGGDNGAATLAELDYPLGITFDTNFNLYISDSNNQRIRKVTTSGIDL